MNQSKQEKKKDATEKKPKKPVEPKPVLTVDAPRQLTTIRFTPCGQWLFGVGLDPRIFRWKCAQTEHDSALSLEGVLPLEGHRGWVTSLAVSETDKKFFTADSWGRLSCRSCADESCETIWSIPQAHEGWLRQLAVSADGQLVASCGLDRQVKLWSTNDGKLLQSWTDHAADVYSVAFHPREPTLVSGDIFGKIIQWDLASGKPIRRFNADVLYFADDDTLQDVGGVRRLIFDSECKNLAACGGKPSSGSFVKATPVVCFFDWTTGIEKETREYGHEKAGFVLDALFHPEGYFVGTTSGLPGEGQLFLWQPGDEKPYFIYTKLPNIHSLSMYRDGRHIAIASTNKKQSGNGRDATSDEDYAGNQSPISLWDTTQLQPS